MYFSLFPKLDLPKGLLRGRGLFKRNHQENEKMAREKLKRRKDLKQHSLKVLESKMKEKLFQLQRIDIEFQEYDRQETGMRVET